MSLLLTSVSSLHEFLISSTNLPSNGFEVVVLLLSLDGSSLILLDGPSLSLLATAAILVHRKLGLSRTVPT